MDVMISILLIVLGLIVGVVGCYIVLNIKRKNAEKTVDKILENAKKDAEKIKRDSLFETKEEIHKLKMEADKEVKERKREAMQKQRHRCADFAEWKGLEKYE